MKIVCILPQLSQPRCIKRIQSLMDAGYQVEVYGFDNGLYSDNIKDLKCCVHSYVIENTSKLFSIKKKIELVKDAINQLKTNDILYLFGIEFAIFNMLFCTRHKYIYEQADLNYTKLNKFLAGLFKIIDKILIKYSLVTVLTSQGFVDYLFKKRNVPSNICLIPNKLHKSLYKCKVNDKKIRDISHLKFAFVGLVRYPRTILTFAQEIGCRFPQHEFHFYGEGQSSDKAKRICEIYDNLYYHGHFKNPEDLPLIYENIDLNVVCYDPMSINVRIAEPNKLYESIYFKAPIIVSKGTFLEKKVKEWQVGFSVNAFDANEVYDFVSHLTIDVLNSAILNAGKIPQYELFDSTSELIDILNKKLNNIEL